MSLVQTELLAVLVALRGDTPCVLTLDDGRRLPSGPLQTEDRSLQAGLRASVERQTGFGIGHMEQLYTFADHPPAQGEPRRVAISYLALTRTDTGDQAPLSLHASVSASSWRSWYGYFPWEDQTTQHGQTVLATILDRLDHWIAGQTVSERNALRHRRDHVFGLAEGTWNDELVLHRYELLYQAGLVPESRQHVDNAEAVSGDDRDDAALFVPGQSMHHDHRRILATGMARLRAKIRYRPVIYELMPEQFTLLALQRAVECVAGCCVHKQNFRRQVAQQGLIEDTGGESREAGGRPARLYRFRRSVVLERTVTGSKLPVVRSR